MNFCKTRLSAVGAKLSVLLGTASVMTLAGAIGAQAQQVAQQTAQAGETPEEVLITGSLIRGTTAVGVPVTNLNPRDFVTPRPLTTAELFKRVPPAPPEGPPPPH